MAEVKLNVYLKDKDSSEFKQVIGQINPNCPDAKLTELVNALNSLTTNKISEIWKVVEKYLAPDSDAVTEQDILDILNGTYTPVPDDDPVTENDIKLILEGNYTPVEDDDTWSPSDFVFITGGLKNE